MNSDQGAHNTRGCDDVTRQSFLPLLHSLSSPSPPGFLFPAAWVGMTEEEGGTKEVVVMRVGVGVQLINLATNRR